MTRHGRQAPGVGGSGRLLREALETGEAAADIVGAAGVRTLLEETGVGLTRGRRVAPELLDPREAEEPLFVEEVLRGEPGHRGLEGDLGLAVILLGLPRVGDAEGGQTSERARGALADGDLVGAPRRPVLSAVVAEIAEAIGGLGGAGEARVVGENCVERPDGLVASVGGRPGGCGVLGEIGGGGERQAPARFLGAVPGVGAEGDGAEPDRGREPGETPARGARVAEPGREEIAHGDQLPAGGAVERLATAGRSTQISPLTEAPSAAEKLPVRSEPVSTPEGRISTRVAAERLPRTVPPITMAAASMLASTCAPSATSTRPVTLISPSNLPRMWKSPSPATSPRNDRRLPMPAAEGPLPLSVRRGCCICTVSSSGASPLRPR